LAVEQQNAIFRSLADPIRRAIFENLTFGEVWVKELTEAFSISQPAVSLHLAALSQPNLVTRRRQGRRTYYRVAEGGLRPLVDWVARYNVFWIELIDALQQLLEEMEE
jgi:DNA-binding transcriptional ArsR family regulator